MGRDGQDSFHRPHFSCRRHTHAPTNQTNTTTSPQHTPQEAAGLNLHGANHVLLLHPYIDPSIQAAELVPLAEAQAFERQAVGRCHRYPQTRPVCVHRYYARGSVEEEMYVCWGLLGGGGEEEGEEEEEEEEGEMA
jgi:hypothetical protein